MEYAAKLRTKLSRALRKEEDDGSPKCRIKKSVNVVYDISYRFNASNEIVSGMASTKPLDGDVAITSYARSHTGNLFSTNTF